MPPARLVEYKGEMLLISEVARRTGITVGALRYRIIEGRMTAEEAVEAIREGRRVYNVAGEQLTEAQMASRAGVPLCVIRKRILNGDTPEQAMREAKTMRMTWYDKAFAMLYNRGDREDMCFREISPGNWGWTSEHFVYMASRLGRRFVLLRAWWRGSEAPAMLRLFALEERENKDDVLTEVVDTALRSRILRKAGMRV